MPHMQSYQLLAITPRGHLIRVSQPLSNYTSTDTEEASCDEHATEILKTLIICMEAMPTVATWWLRKGLLQSQPLETINWLHKIH